MVSGVEKEVSSARWVGDILFEQIGWEPTERQGLILRSRKRQVLVSGGEQSGKSVCAAKYLLTRIPEKLGKTLYWLVAADYERTRAEYEYLVEDLGKVGLLVKATKRVDPGVIEFGPDGSRIETKSASDPRTLAMRAPEGIVICEASQVDLTTYMKCLARTAPKRGWLFMSGTMEGSLGWFPGMVAAWRGGLGDKQSFILPSTSNKHVYPGGEQDPEILRLKAESSDEFFMERIMGVPVPPRGLVFPEFRADLHAQEVEYDYNQGVLLWIDPGYDGAYAVEVVQIVDGQVRIVDEVYERGLVTDDIITICEGKRWWKKVAGGAVDIAGYQHQAMPAVAEVWLERTGLRLNAEKVRIEEGTERLKSMLKWNPLLNQPRFVVNPKCAGLLSEFGVVPNPFDGQSHAYKWRTDRDGNIVGDTPDDKWNHAIKACIYGLVAELGYVTVQKRETLMVKRF